MSYGRSMDMEADIKQYRMVTRTTEPETPIGMSFTGFFTSSAIVETAS